MLPGQKQRQGRVEDAALLSNVFLGPWSGGFGGFEAVATADGGHPQVHGCVAGEIAACDCAVTGRVIHADLYQLVLGDAVTEVLAASALSVVDVEHDVDLLSVCFNRFDGGTTTGSARLNVRAYRRCAMTSCSFAAIVVATQVQQRESHLMRCMRGCWVWCCDCVAALPSD